MLLGFTRQNINIRDAFVGGRTDGFKSYHKCTKHQKIFYYDVVSLYPTVNALDADAVGFPKYVNLTLDDVDKAAQIAVQNPYWNPRTIGVDSESALKNLLQRAWEGGSPIAS